MIIVHPANDCTNKVNNSVRFANKNDTTRIMLIAFRDGIILYKYHTKK